MSSGTNIKYSTYNFFKGIAEYFTPVLTKSHFQEKGVLTPEEFVNAGDLLVEKCPTWAWASGEKDKVVSWLPPNKQFLITKNVPCLKRAKSLDVDTDEKDVEDDWVETHISHTKKQEVVEEITEMKEEIDIDDDDVIDMDEYEGEEDLIQDQDESTLDTKNENILKTRTYDIAISYDKFYQTPRVWLFGYDENGQPLDTTKIMEDIYADYSLKTVTIEQHPHLNSRWASIHPCRHAEVMKKMIDRLQSDGKYVRVDLYLFVFLKFISAVIPTIEYDFTIQVNAATSKKEEKDE